MILFLTILETHIQKIKAYLLSANYEHAQVNCICKSGTCIYKYLLLCAQLPGSPEIIFRDNSATVFQKNKFKLNKKPDPGSRIYFKFWPQIQKV